MVERILTSFRFYTKHFKIGQNEKEEHGAGRHEKAHRCCLETNAALDLDIQFLVFLSLKCGLRGAFHWEEFK